MKRFLPLLILLMTAICFTSCEEDPDFADSDYKGTYCYVVPCLQWNASIDEVRKYMKSMECWNSSSSQLGKYALIYRQEKTHNDIMYTFHSNKLTSVTISWYSCLEDFDKMREEYASKMNFTWEGYDDKLYVTYSAISHELHCDISAHTSELNGVRQMNITFDYAKNC